MAAKIEWQRDKDKTASITEMLAHDDYLNNPTHKDHAGYTMVPGRNYNCLGQTRDDLVAAIQLAHANQIRRKQLLKIRRRTSQKWGECIFNLGPKCFITKNERDKIEREFITRLFPDAAARATWHINEETGKCDLHIIFAHLRPCGKLTLERTKTGLAKRMQILDRYAADLLNNNPDKPANRIPDIQTSEAVAEADAQKYSMIREDKEAAAQAEDVARNPKKKTSPQKTPKNIPTKKKSTAQSRKLPAQVAHQAEIDGIAEVEAHHVPGLLERIGIKILQIIGGIIKYESSRMTQRGKALQHRKGTIRIHDFLFDVLHAQVDMRLEREQEMREIQLETQLETQPAAPAAPAAPVRRTKTPAERAAILEAFLKARLGYAKVSSKKLKFLTEATKRMFTPGRDIKPKLLKSLTPEQRQILVPLAKEYANEM